MAGNDSYLLTALISFVCAGGGAYLGSYLKKKGENLATKEDFRELKTQTAELRQATREIEAKIDNQVWDRQRQWEMKRDIVVELVKVMKEFEQATLALGTAIRSKVEAPPTNQPLFQGKINERLAIWSPLSTKFEQYIYLGTLVFGMKTIANLYAVSKIVRDISGDVLTQKDPNAYTSRNVELFQQLNELRDVIREELGLPAILQSNESSASPNPD